MSLKKWIPSLLLALPVVDLSAYQSSEAFLTEIDQFLTDREMSRLVPKDRVIDIAKLSQEEDMGVDAHYLITDEMLKLLKPQGVVATDFGSLVEGFQAEVDRLGEEDRAIALSEWRTLWMEKVMQHLTYVKSLKNPWRFQLTQVADYNSNAALTDPDTAPADFRGEDVGLSLDGGITYRPTINVEEDWGWGYTAKVNAFRQFQDDKQELDVEMLSTDHEVKWNAPIDGVRDISLGWNYIKSFSKAPGADQAEYDRHALRLKARSDIKATSFALADAYFHRGSLQHRWKEEIPTPLDLNTWVASYGVTFLRSGKDVPFQSMTADIAYENEKDDGQGLRDYNASSLRLGYTRSLGDALLDLPSTWMSSVSVRNKNASSSSADEVQLYASTAVMVSIKPFWSSSLALSYLDKDKSGSPDVEQWRVAWTNVLSTF
jgi:hypothetical protein